MVTNGRRAATRTREAQEDTDDSCAPLLAPPKYIQIRIILSTVPQSTCHLPLTKSIVRISGQWSRTRYQMSPVDIRDIRGLKHYIYALTMLNHYTRCISNMTSILVPGRSGYLPTNHYTTSCIPTRVVRTHGSTEKCQNAQYEFIEKMICESLRWESVGPICTSVSRMFVRP